MLHASHAINHWWQWHNKSVMASQISGNREGLFNSLFRLTSKQTSKPVLLALCEENPPVTCGSPPNGPVMQTVFPCPVIIMCWCNRRHYVCIVYSTYVHIIAGSVMMRHWLVLSNTVNSLRPSDAYMRRWTVSSLVQIMACRLFSAKPLSEPMLEYWTFRNKLQ